MHVLTRLAFFLSQTLLSLLGRGHCKSVEAVVEDTLSRIACSEGAVVDAHRSEDISSPPQSPPPGRQNRLWAEDPFLLE